MSKSEIELLWDQLKASPAFDQAGGFRIRLLASAQSVRIFAAIALDSGGVAVVVDVPESLRPSRLSGFNFRRLRVSVGSIPGLPPRRAAIVIELRDRDFEDLFGQLVDDIVGVAGVATSAAAVVSSISSVVSKWQRFLEARAAPLSPLEVRGLVGELAVLERLAKGIGASRALASWQSPRGSIRDFETSDRSIEVKTFSPSTGNVVRISDPLQLEADPGRGLFIVCQALSSSDSVGDTLPVFASRVAKSFAGDVRLAEDYDEALAAAGYLACHSQLYPTRFILGELLAFRVADDFPRIAVAQIPPEVRNVEFSIPLSALSRYAVALQDFIGSPS
jgi:hypothetical protein